MEDSTVKKLAKKSGLPEAEVVKILAEEQLYTNHYKNLKKVNTNFNLKSLKLLEKQSKLLKVSVSSIVSVMLKNYLERVGS